jgi:pilus assembly protein CpaC
MDGKGKEVLNASIKVTYNVTELKEMIAPFDPYDLVEVKSIPGGIVLEGQVDSPRVADDIVGIARGFLAKSSGSSAGTSSSGGGSGGGASSGGGTSSSASSTSTGATVINRLTIKSPVQVNLRVKVAEVQRAILNQFGIDWQAVGKIGSFNFGALTGRSPISTPTNAPIAANNTLNMIQGPSVNSQTNLNALGFNITTKNVNINAVLDALSQDGLVTILAEPNLVAVSGETASFLAGGEFPIPVPQGLAQVTIAFKQFGVSLSFTPTVLDGRLISLRVRPEVSELDHSTAVTVLGTSVPGILTRRAETTIELASGQTFAIAGLMKYSAAASINALPGLGDLPVLGALFRSNSFLSGETELVILVTPYLVEPVSGKEMPLPTDGLTYASFIEQIFERRILKEGPQKGEAPLFGPGGLRLVGPAGFSIE